MEACEKFFSTLQYSFNLDFLLVELKNVFRFSNEINYAVFEISTVV